MRTITIANHKGGCGKSTTAMILTQGLARRGFRVLLIDLDSQGNTSYSLSDDIEKIPVSKFFSEKNIDIFRPKVGMDPKIFAATSEWCLSDQRQKFSISDFKQVLERVSALFDYVVIDTAPALNELLIVAISVSDRVIIPMQADIYSMQGLSREIDIIEDIRERTNKPIAIAGLLLLRYNPRSSLSKSIYNQLGTIADKFGTKVYKATIRESIAIKECQYLKANLFRDYKRNKVVEDCNAFIDEFLSDLKRS